MVFILGSGFRGCATPGVDLTGGYIIYSQFNVCPAQVAIRSMPTAIPVI